MPVLNKNTNTLEISNRMVHWIGEGMRRNLLGHRMILADEPQKFELGWMDETDNLTMRIRIKELRKQQQEIIQVFGKKIWDLMMYTSGREKLFCR